MTPPHPYINLFVLFRGLTTTGRLNVEESPGDRKVILKYVEYDPDMILTFLFSREERVPRTWRRFTLVRCRVSQTETILLRDTRCGRWVGTRVNDCRRMKYVDGGESVTRPVQSLDRYPFCPNWRITKTLDQIDNNIDPKDHTRYRDPCILFHCRLCHQEWVLLNDGFSVNGYSSL